MRKMIDKITESLTCKIRKKMPEIDDERAEVINFGLQILIGEIPKIFIMLFLAYILGVFNLTLLTFLILLPYKGASGGFHLKTHIGCIVSTTAFYCGIAILAKNIVLTDITKYIMIGIVGLFGVIMIKLYAPADTEDVPIISKKVRKQNQINYIKVECLLLEIWSYIFFILGLIISAVVPSNIISNLIIFGYFVQTCMITRLAYKLTNNKYGYEVYGNATN